LGNLGIEQKTKRDPESSQEAAIQVQKICKKKFRDGIDTGSFKKSWCY